VTTREHQLAAQRFRAIYATYLGAEDLINIGAFSAGSNRRIDTAVSLIDRINEFLIQPIGAKTAFKDTVARLGEITKAWDFLMPDDELTADAVDGGRA
jgi:flagellum-specific ATP synthase